MKSQFVVWMSGCLLVMLISCGKTPSPSVVTPMLAGTQEPTPPFIREVDLVSLKPERKDEVEAIMGKDFGPLVEVCIALEFRELVVKEDQNLDDDDYYERSGLRIWSIDKGARLIKETGLIRRTVGSDVRDNRGNQLGYSSYCWMYPLPPGLYKATYSYVQPSGKVLSYTWQFETVE